MGLIALLLSWIPYSLPPIAFTGLVVGIPGLLTLLFWTRLSEMELTQIITTRRMASPDEDVQAHGMFGSASIAADFGNGLLPKIN